MSIAKVLLAVVVLAILTPSFSIWGGKAGRFQEPTAPTQYWFNDQLIDHFNPKDTRTFAQRYWVEPQYYNPSKGRVLFYICGENTCAGVKNTSYYMQVAIANQALVVVLEHRYYGLSLPFGNNSLTLDSLTYLTVEQALADCAHFIGWMKGNNSVVNIPLNSKWVVVGGSYAGAMSAWFRLKYPHLVVGSWASSSVINAITDFTDYDYQIFLATNASGPACPKTIQNLTAYVESNLYEYGAAWALQFKSKFGPSAAKLTNEEFLYYFADVFSAAVQYSQRVELCNYLATYTSFDDIVRYFNQSGIDPITYSANFTALTNWDINYSANRLWTYQVCTQFGWFQTAHPNPAYSLRSKFVNITFFENYCKQVFGAPLWPNTDLINNEFGGKYIASSNTLIVNGGEDPWLWASNLNIGATNPLDTSYTANCNNCGHCIDLKQPTVNDPVALTNVRVKILNNITNWFNAPRSSPVMLDI